MLYETFEKMIPFFWNGKILVGGLVKMNAQGHFPSEILNYSLHSYYYIMIRIHLRILKFDKCPRKKEVFKLVL